MIRLLTSLYLLMNLLPLMAQDQLVAERNDGWNSFEMDWFFRDSLEYGYSEEAELLFINIRDFEDGAWPYVKRLENTYDETGNPLSSTELSRIDDTWQLLEGDNRLLWEYNANGQLTLDLTEVWDGTTWQPESREINTYQETNNYQEERLGQNWLLGNWQNTYRFRFEEYDQTGNLLLEIQEWWEEEAWLPHVRVSRSYNSEGLILEQSVESYVEPNWRPAFRRTFEYNAEGHRTGWLQESWNAETESWNPSYREMYELNDDGTWLIFISQSWAPAQGEWRNLIRSELAYNLESQNTFTLTERWNSSDGMWGNLERSYYYFGEGVTEVREAINTFSGMEIYPNPALGQLIVKIKSEELKSGQLRLMSINGQTLSTFRFDNEIKDKLLLDLGNFPAGKYVIQLIGEGYSSSSVVILK